MPDNRKDKSGGRKPGSGRPKGSKNINSMASVRKLEELGFDPIEMMVKKYQEIQSKLETYHTKATVCKSIAPTKVIGTFLPICQSFSLVIRVSLFFFISICK